MTRRILVLLFLLLAALAATAAAAPAGAAPAPASVTIESREAELVEKDDGSWTTSLAFTNMTADTTITLSATATGCTPTLDKSATLRPSERTKVMVTIPATCPVAKEGFTFEVAATAAGANVGSFTIKAGPKEDDEEVDWSPLGVFPIALGVFLFAGVVLYPAWDPLENRRRRRKPYGNLGKPLPHLGEKWSFKDSWVSNVTAAAALLTGIFASSNVLKAALGGDADNAAAVATVGVAIAAAFVAAGGVILEATKTYDARPPLITVGGFVGAAAVVLAGAFGELWTVYESARRLDLDGWQAWIRRGAIAGMVLLIVLAVRTVPSVVRQGGSPPPPKTKNGKTKKARRGFAALRHDEVEAIASDPSIPRRAALL